MALTTSEPKKPNNSSKSKKPNNEHVLASGNTLDKIGDEPRVKQRSGVA